MPVLQKLKHYLFPTNQLEMTAAAAYDNWATYYDSQPNNLMLALDEKIMDFLLVNIDITDKVIVDVGCGTGRHWQKILNKKPANLIGYDVSVRMLDKLTEKFPFAKTHLLKDNYLKNLNDESCDIIISTLTIAHIENFKNVFGEWNRVLKNNGFILITDYHPTALAKGGKRTFKHNGHSVAIKNYIHEIATIRKNATEKHLTEIKFKEEIVDDTVKKYYEKQDALSVFEKFNGTPIIYGILLKKNDAIK